MSDAVLFCGLAIDGLVLFIASNQIFVWPKQESPACRYDALAERTCSTYPDETERTVIGSRFETLSSLMFIAGACLALYFIYRRGTTGKPVLLTAVCLYFGWLGVASFMFWKTHCRTWWRADINSTRSFPYILSFALVFVTTTSKLYNDAVAAVLTLSPLALILPVFWHDTELPSTWFFIIGALATTASLIYAYTQTSQKTIVVWLFIVLVLGSSGILFQSYSVLCAVHPAAVGHTILGFVPPLLALLA